MRDPVYPVQRRRRKSLLGRFALWTGLLACLLVVVAVFSTPWVVRHAVPEIFARHGVQASVQGGRLSLLRAELTLTGFKLGEREAPALSLGEIGIGVDARALVRGRLRVQRLRVEGAEFDPRRLRSLHWRAAGGSAASAGALPVDVAELHFEDLRLTPISERIGSDVRVSRLVVRDLARLTAGEKARIELEMSLAGAPAVAQADLVMHGSDMMLTGRYRVDEVALAGWSGMWPDSGVELHAGTLRASGSLAGTYHGDTRRVELTLDGDARVAALELAHPALRVSGADVTWNGPLVLDWPSLDAAPVLRGDGSVGVDHGTIGVADVEATLRELSWKGSAQWSRGLSAEGSVRGERIELGAAGAAHTGRGRATLEQLALHVRVVQSLSPDTLSAHVRDVAARRLVFASPGADAAIEGGIDGFEIDEIRAAHTGDFVIGQARAQALWAARSISGAAQSSLRAREVSLGGLSGNLSGELQVASAVARTVGFAAGIGSADLDTVRLVSVGYRHPGQLGAEELAVDNARLGSGEDEIWLDTLHAARIYRERTGHAGADLVRAATIYQVGAGRGSWEASTLALHAVEREPAGLVRSADFELEQFVHADAGAAWTARDMRGTDVMVHGAHGTAGAAELTLKSLEGIQPEVGDLSAIELRASAVSVDAQGTTLDTARAATVSFHDALGNRYQADDVTAAGLQGALASGVRAAHIEASRVTGTGPGADRLDGSSLELEGLAVDAARALTATALRVETFRYDAGRNVTVALRAASGERLRWSADTPLSLATGRIGHLDVSGAGFDAVRLVQLETGDLVWDRGERLDAARVFAASVRGASGVPWEALAVTGHALSYRLPAGLDATALQVETLRHDAEPSTWEVDGLAAEQIRLDDDSGHRVASLRAGALRLRDTTASASFTRAELEELRVGGTDLLGAARVRASGVSLGTGEASRPERLEVSALELDAPRLTHAGLLDLGDVVLDGASLVVGRDSGEHWLLPAMPGAAAATADGELRIRSLATRGAARLEFFDTETAPTFRMAFEPFAVALGDLDTGLPGKETTLQAMGTTDAFTRLEVSGMLVTGVDDMDVDINAELIGVDARDFNPYLATREPYEVTAGHGDVRVEFAVRDGELKGEAKVTMSGMRLRPVTGPLSLGGGLPGRLPLNTVIRLLQDAEGNLELRFPLEARVDRPGFDFIETFGDTMSTAARAAAGVPGKSLNRVLDTVESIITLLPGLAANSYPPVVFAPGSAALDARAKEYLGALADRLHKRAGLRVRVCPVVVPGEAPALEAAIAARDPLFARAAAGVFDPPASPAALAGRRAAAVERFIESRGVSADRFAACESRVDERTSAEPRVKIEMQSPRS